MSSMRLRHSAAATRRAKSEPDVFGDAHVRPKRKVLKHHADAARPRRRVNASSRRNDLSMQPNLAAIGCNQSGDEQQCGRFSTAGRAEQYDALTRFDREGEGIDNAPGAVDFGDRAEFDGAHGRATPNLSHSPAAASGNSVTAMRMMHSAAMTLGAPLAMRVRMRTERVSAPGG